MTNCSTWFVWTSPGRKRRKRGICHEVSDLRSSRRATSQGRAEGRQSPQAGQEGAAGRNHGEPDCPELLGQALVQAPGVLLRLPQPVAARPQLRAPRRGLRLGDPGRPRRRTGLRHEALPRRHSHPEAQARCLEVHQGQMHRTDRIGHRVAPGTALRPGDGCRHGSQPRPVSDSAPDRVRLRLPGLGRHVQARGFGPVRRRQPARRQPRTPLPAAKGRRIGAD